MHFILYASYVNNLFYCLDIYTKYKSILHSLGTKYFGNFNEQKAAHRNNSNCNRLLACYTFLTLTDSYSFGFLITISYFNKSYLITGPPHNFLFFFNSEVYPSFLLKQCIDKQQSILLVDT